MFLKILNIGGAENDIIRINDPAKIPESFMECHPQHPQPNIRIWISRPFAAVLVIINNGIQVALDASLHIFFTKVLFIKQNSN